jgi:hypothetical protein
MMLKGR